MKKIAEKMKRAKKKMMAPLLAAYAAVAMCAPKLIAFAGDYDKGAKIMKGIFGLISLPVIVYGGWFAIIGAVHYAAANTEGDGPAKHKASAQIGGGIMIIVIGISLNLSIVQNLITSIFS